MIGPCVKYFINAVFTYFLDWFVISISLWFRYSLLWLGVELWFRVYPASPSHVS
ncbi:hypothetical protein [Vulcanisaeta moutnovskia]|uniref:hypothetical protein n=1 Tax=Vulcanisaeta moutnovskia TaxID=985052 RepID=UPI001305192F|nr:hypothetical protein [Vulcanisaeta moutnovskia]